MYEVAVRPDSSLSLPQGGSPPLAICPWGPLPTLSVFCDSCPDTDLTHTWYYTQSFSVGISVGTSHTPVMSNIFS